MKTEALKRAVRRLELKSGAGDWRTLDVAALERTRQKKLAEVEAMSAMTAEERTVFQAELRRREIERLCGQIKLPGLPAPLRDAMGRMLKFLQEEPA